MKDTSLHITNRYGLRLFVRTFVPDKPKGLAFIAHGLSDNHATQTMLTLRAAFLEQGYSVVVWDATNSSWGQSEGRFEDANFTKHYHDLEDIIAWAKDHKWFEKRFTLAGYSLGGIACGTYAAQHNDVVKNLVLVAPVVSGQYLQNAIPFPARVWWRIRGSLLVSRKYKKRYSWELMRDGLDYDLVMLSRYLTMSTLIVGAGKDVFVKAKTLELLHEAIPQVDKKLLILPRAGHRFMKYHDKLHWAVVEWLKDHQDASRLPITKVASELKELIAKLR